jgi:type I restriction enzyme S subunit
MTFYKETEFQETPIGRIPKGWDVAKLEDICEKVRAGGTPLTSKKEYWDGDLPFVKIEDVTLAGKYLTATKSFISKEGLSNSSAWLVPEDSLLFAMYGSMGEVSINKIPVTTNQAILGIIPRDRDDVEFLYYWYSFFKPRWKKYAKPTTQANLTAEILRNSVIPLPSKEERRAIVGVLGVVDSVIGLVDRVILKTERLKKGLMQTLLTRGIGHKEYKQTPIGTIPKEWQVVKIEDIADTSSGGTPNRTKKEYYGGNIPWVKSGELKDNIIYDTEEKITESGLKNSAAKLFPRGTLLVAMYGATVGKTGILRIDATTNQAVCAILPKDDSLNLSFLQHYIIFARNRWISQSSGGAQPNISQEIIRTSRIPLPTYEEQQKIAEILSNVDKKLELENKEKSRLERIKQGLMDLLLTGKIRVKVD